LNKNSENIRLLTFFFLGLAIGIILFRGCYCQSGGGGTGVFDWFYNFFGFTGGIAVGNETGHGGGPHFDTTPSATPTIIPSPSPSPSPSPVPSPSTPPICYDDFQIPCYDSDGGDNSMVFGTLTYNGTSYNDTCISGFELIEYSCTTFFGFSEDGKKHLYFLPQEPEEHCEPTISYYKCPCIEGVCMMEGEP